MPQTPHEQALMHLLNAYTALCPTQSDKDAIRATIAACQRDGLSPTALCRAVCGHLYDGLAWGNWPSNLAKLGKAD